MYYHDPIKHSRYLKQALSQNKSQIAFFLAAGCPLAVEMENDKWPLIPDIAGLTSYIKEELLKIGKLRYSELLDEMTKSNFLNPNIEEVLSFVRSLIQVSTGGSVRGFTSVELEEVEKTICSKIAEKIDVELPSTDTPYHRLANWIQSVQRAKCIEIFTANYDLLLEQALENKSVPYFDGFVGSRNSFFDLRSVENDTLPNHWARLWKIHGSLNWFKNSEGNITRGYNSASKSGSSEYKDKHLIYPSHLKYNESRKMPFLALIDRLGKFISYKGATLIICGYSFNDEHLNDTILKAMQSNSTAAAFCLLYGNMNKYPNAKKLAEKCPNLSVFAEDMAIIGTTEAKWAIHQPLDEVEQSISFLIKSSGETPSNSKYTESKFSIGDFNKFSLFLKYLISEDYSEAENAK